MDNKKKKVTLKQKIKLMDALDYLDKLAEEGVQGDARAWVEKGMAYNLIMEFIHSK